MVRAEGEPDTGGRPVAVLKTKLGRKTLPEPVREEVIWGVYPILTRTSRAGSPRERPCVEASRRQRAAVGKRRALPPDTESYFRIDKPLLDDQGRRLENFTRVETFGDNAPNGNNDIHWTKALVDPKSRDVFAFQPQIVPANRTAVPTP